MTDRATFAAELAAKLTDDVNSDAVQEFLEAKGVDYDHTDIDGITLLVEQDPVYRARPFLTLCGPHDVGVMEVGCACPSGDYRPVMARLVDEIVRLRGVSA